jgi:hypothetical protein
LYPSYTYQMQCGTVISRDHNCNALSVQPSINHGSGHNSASLAHEKVQKKNGQNCSSVMIAKKMGWHAPDILH